MEGKKEGMKEGKKVQSNGIERMESKEGRNRRKELKEGGNRRIEEWMEGKKEGVREGKKVRRKEGMESKQWNRKKEEIEGWN
jgi:hypothetical protein